MIALCEIDRAELEAVQGGIVDFEAILEAAVLAANAVTSLVGVTIVYQPKG